MFKIRLPGNSECSGDAGDSGPLSQHQAPGKHGRDLFIMVIVGTLCSLHTSK